MKCTRCGYNLAGLKSDRCPECGLAAAGFARAGLRLTTGELLLYWGALVAAPVIVANSGFFFDRSDYGWPSRGIGGLLTIAGVFIVPCASGLVGYFLTPQYRVVARAFVSVAIAVGLALLTFVTTAIMNFALPPP